MICVRGQIIHPTKQASRSCQTLFPSQTAYVSVSEFVVKSFGKCEKLFIKNWFYFLKTLHAGNHKTSQQFTSQHAVWSQLIFQIAFPLHWTGVGRGCRLGSSPHSFVLVMINTTWCQVVSLVLFTFRETVRFTAVVWLWAAEPCKG